MPADNVIRIHVTGQAGQDALPITAILAQKLTETFRDLPTNVVDLGDFGAPEKTASVISQLDSRQMVGLVAIEVEDRKASFELSVRSIHHRPEPREIVPGLYRHYKGGTFEVVRVVKDCDRDMEYVVFHREGDRDGQWYTRSMDDFNSMVSAQDNGPGSGDVVSLTDRFVKL